LLASPILLWSPILSPPPLIPPAATNLAIEKTQTQTCQRLNPPITHLFSPSPKPSSTAHIWSRWQNSPSGIRSLTSLSPRVFSLVFLCLGACVSLLPYYCLTSSTDGSVSAQDTAKYPSKQCPNIFSCPATWSSQYQGRHVTTPNLLTVHR